ncbi:hypothetical protein VTI28DRAFT_4899 [Corynascus sepedonium]
MDNNLLWNHRQVCCSITSASIAAHVFPSLTAHDQNLRSERDGSAPLPAQFELDRYNPYRLPTHPNLFPTSSNSVIRIVTGWFLGTFRVGYRGPLKTLKKNPDPSTPNYIEGNLRAVYFCGRRMDIRKMWNKKRGRKPAVSMVSAAHRAAHVGSRTSDLPTAAPTSQSRSPLCYCPAVPHFRT